MLIIYYNNYIDLNEIYHYAIRDQWCEWGEIKIDFRDNVKLTLWFIFVVLYCDVYSVMHV